MTAGITNLEALRNRLDNVCLRPRHGVLTEVQDAVVRAQFAGVSHGTICQVVRPSAPPLQAEVIGISGDDILLSPFGPTKGLQAGYRVHASEAVLTIPVGDALLGRIVDVFGLPMDGGEQIPPETLRYPVRADAPAAMERPLIDTPLPTGLRAIDGPLTLGKGQRVGLFGSPGTGKSTLLAAIARHSDADVIVIGLVGERGREVREFIERDLSAEARDRITIVVATSDRPAIERAICAQSATAVAEGFRDQGKSVLLLVDSLTRTARALREIGLAAGELPTRRGFPASVYPALPAIIERAGRHGTGDITALYTVLLEGEINSDPIAEEVKSLTDGHLILSRALAEAGHYPALDVVESLSRSMNAIVPAAHRNAASRMRRLMAKYREIELLLQVGEYSSGGDADADAAVQAKDRIDAFLRQNSGERAVFDSAAAAMAEAIQ